MRVLIADDEPLALERLRGCLARMEHVELVGAAREGEEALHLARLLKPDLLLLDIQMPRASGIDVAHDLAGSGVDIAFVTAFSDCATIAFDLDAVDYLLKPVGHDRLAEAIVRARRRRRACRQSANQPNAPAWCAPAPNPPPAPNPSPASTPFAEQLWVRQKTGHRRVLVSDIDRIEADRDYALLHTSLRTFILRITMHELEQRLDPAELIRVHRSAFVRPAAVARVEGHRRTSMKLHLHDGAIVEVGASYAEAILQALGIVAADA